MPSADPQPTAPDAVAELAATPAGITIHGEATPEQVAALVAVLAGASGSGGEETGATPSHWADHARALRSGSSHGPGGWRASAQPR